MKFEDKKNEMFHICLLTSIVLSTALTYVKFNNVDVVTFSKNTQCNIKQLLHERYSPYIEINL